MMLGKLSTIGAAIAIVLMIPRAPSARMGGAVNPGVHVGGAVNPGATVRGAVSSEASRAPIWGLGARRVGKFTVAVSILPKATPMMALTSPLTTFLRNVTSVDCQHLPPNSSAGRTA